MSFDIYRTMLHVKIIRVWASGLQVAILSALDLDLNAKGLDVKYTGYSGLGNCLSADGFRTWILWPPLVAKVEHGYFASRFQRFGCRVWAAGRSRHRVQNLQITVEFVH